MKKEWVEQIKSRKYNDMNAKKIKKNKSGSRLREQPRKMFNPISRLHLKRSWSGA
jgi:hypothetical protein